ncbi:hypothetical protein [Winogradskyella haliclonae]|uniref:DinB family protein n=1 Tax=Winogradskyella haliclonae TaxID=2048558 RepID=A0ABQ2BYV8_9FLAO|nr:hypothetical protein [Winogradskyella haliclonae]GGI57106.1 hypothetical protein GCM10011444_14150 [Winogradskyella haliclonae]
MKNALKIFVLILCTSVFGQVESKDELPYYEVPEYSKEFTAGTMAARMVDALGFRFYWASYELTDKDLAYKLNEDGRSTAETIDHIYDLSKIIINSTLKKPNSREDKEEVTYAQKRAATLKNLKTAADILRQSDDISEFKIIFGEQKIPFWNQVNGPIADAIWHCGQIATYRRASGNPINPKVNHFTGKVRN